MKPLNFVTKFTGRANKNTKKTGSMHQSIQKNSNAIAKYRLPTILVTAFTLTAVLTTVGFSPLSASARSQQQQQQLTPKQSLNQANIQTKQSKSQIIVQRIDNLKQSNQRWIEIRLKQQRLLAWEGDQYVYGATVSTGKAATPTLTGVFAVQTKLRQTRMRGADYDIPDVPHTMYYDGGYAIHGAYWHNRFGTPISHGCINLKPQQARWLFNWTTVGTPIIIRN